LHDAAGVATAFGVGVDEMRALAEGPERFFAEEGGGADQG
jgi:hypothetical protein